MDYHYGRLSFIARKSEENMEKTSIKRIFAAVLALIISLSALVGCSVFEYDEESDYGQVVIELKPMDIEYKVPIYTDYLDLNGNPVYALDEDPSSASFGKATRETVKTVKRDHNGDPIYETKKDASGNLLFIGYEYKDESGNTTYSAKEVLKSDASALKITTSDEYYINPETGDEYKFLGISSTTGQAYWRNLHQKQDVLGSAQDRNNAVVQGDASVPLIKYDSARILENYFSYEINRPVVKTDIFHYEGDQYFKQDLIAQFDQTGKTYSEEEGMNIDKVFDRIVKNMYSEFIYVLEAEVMVKEGKTDYGVTEENKVNQQIYSVIDSRLNTIYGELASKIGQSVPTISAKTDSEPTYPKKGEEQQDDEAKKEYKVWHISQEPERCLNVAVEDTRRCSLERAGLRQFVHDLSDTLDGIYALTKEQKQLYRDEVNEMLEESKSDEKIAPLYKKLYKYEFIRFLYGSSTEKSIKSSLMEDYLCKDLGLDDETIVNNFASMYSKQYVKYETKKEDYYSACADGSETILYFADSNIFWVQHILLPFSTEQVEKLNNYKLNNSDESVIRYRESLASSMVVYPHVDGEDDKDNPKTLNEAFSEIYTKMAVAGASEYDALNTFYDLIYDYNTDPGIFNNEMGYAVTVKGQEFGGEEEKYMIEFAREARALYGAYKANETLYEYKSHSADYAISDFENSFYKGIMKNAGVVGIGSISAPVITDYGVHILMLNFVPSAKSSRQLNEYLTAARRGTVKEAIAEDILETMRSNKLNAWKNVVVGKYETKVEYDSYGNVNDPNVAIAVYKTRFDRDLADYKSVYFINKDASSDEEES